MSANNWRECPKCVAENAKQIERDSRELASQYGKLTQDEWLKRHREIAGRSGDGPDNTLREDYQIGVHQDGEFRVSYRCSCETCGFEWQFKTSQQALQATAPSRQTART